MRERVERRTPLSRLTNHGNGTKTLELGRSPLHYVGASGRLVDIDLTPEFVGNKFLINKAPYVLQVDPIVPAYRYISSNAPQVEVELVEVGHLSVVGKAEQQGQLFVWPGVGIDTDYVVRPLRWGCSTYLNVASDKAPRDWKWRVRGNYDLLLPLRGYDAKGQRLELEQSFDGEYLSLHWTGRVTSSFALRAARKVVWNEDVAYPLLIDPTVNEAVAAGADDAWSVWTSGGTVFGSFSNTQAYSVAGSYIGGGYNSRYYVGIRFITVDVPTGAVITSATLTLDVLSATAPNVNIYGVDVDNAAQFSSPGNRIKNITQTTAFTNITGATTGIRNFTITSIVQEIVNRGGWAANNAMAFGLLDQSDGALNFINSNMFDHPSAQEPRMSITYVAGGAIPVFKRPTRFFRKRF